MKYTLEQIKSIIKDGGYTISNETRSGNNYGTVLTISNGCIVNCWDKGTVSFQGKNTEEIKNLIEAPVKQAVMNRKVFVVYGHDTNAKAQLDAMLRRWDMEPLIFDQLVSNGQTIIEKLEDQMSKVDFGIVLATPDDIGYAKGNEDKKKYRVRQNVVLELGMLLARLGRSKVAILRSQAEDMDNPSDIDGLLYIPFKENVEETKVSLAKEMRNNGYTIDIANL